MDLKYVASVLCLVAFLAVLTSGCLSTSDFKPGNQSGNATQEFCGWSSGGECSSDSDCKTGGCSSQVCQSRKESGLVTTCEWRECYDASKYGVACKCAEGKCKWSG